MLRLVTWNVHGCIGTDRRHDPLRIARLLATLHADVVGLQEVDARRPRVGGRHPLALWARELGMTAVAGPNLRDERGDYGNALLTRFDVHSVERRSLAETGREPRGAIDAVLHAPSGPLRVVVTHLGLRGAERRRQCARLRAALEGPSHPPTALLGDLNEWRPRPFIASPLVPDPFPTAVTARTFPSRLPLFALDRILLRPEPARLAFRVVRTPLASVASDHLPLVVDVEWSEDRAPPDGLRKAARSGGPSTRG